MPGNAGDRRFCKGALHPSTTACPLQPPIMKYYYYYCCAASAGNKYYCHRRSLNKYFYGDSRTSTLSMASSCTAESRPLVTSVDCPQHTRWVRTKKKQKRWPRRVESSSLPRVFVYFSVPLHEVVAAPAWHRASEGAGLPLTGRQENDG